MIKQTYHSLFLILILILSSCGKKEEKEGDVITGGTIGDPALFNSYVATFKQYRVLAGGADSIAPSTIVFVPTLGSSILGTCTMSSGVVKISQQLWNVIGKESREQLILHELGHCTLGRFHDNTVDGSSYPVSMMNSFHMAASVYGDPLRYFKFIAELFTVSNATFASVTFDPNRYDLAMASTIELEIEHELNCEQDHNGDFTVTLE